MNKILLADQLGTIKAQISDLTAIEKDIKNQILGTGEDSIEGDYFSVTVSRSTRATTAWKAICEKLGASRQIIKGNTKVSPVTIIKAVARKRAA